VVSEAPSAADDNSRVASAPLPGSQNLRHLVADDYPGTILILHKTNMTPGVSERPCVGADNEEVSGMFQFRHQVGPIEW
jgi:hypothetical protein